MLARETTSLTISIQKILESQRAIEADTYDVCGLMHTPSHEQNKYFILLQNYTRMMQVYIYARNLKFRDFQKVQKLCRKAKWLQNQNYQKRQRQGIYIK